MSDTSGSQRKGKKNKLSEVQLSDDKVLQESPLQVTETAEPTEATPSSTINNDGSEGPKYDAVTFTAALEPGGDRTSPNMTKAKPGNNHEEITFAVPKNTTSCVPPPKEDIGNASYEVPNLPYTPLQTRQATLQEAVYSTPSNKSSARRMFDSVVQKVSVRHRDDVGPPRPGPSGSCLQKIECRHIVMGTSLAVALLALLISVIAIIVSSVKGNCNCS